MSNYLSSKPRISGSEARAGNIPEAGWPFLLKYLLAQRLCPAPDTSLRLVHRLEEGVVSTLACGIHWPGGGGQHGAEQLICELHKCRAWALTWLRNSN